jgi:hypothetical protein
MSQSKTDVTVSGSSGANVQLSSLRSLWTIAARPPVVPTGDLALHVAVGPAQTAQPHGLGRDHVEVRRGVDQREVDAAGDVVVAAHLRGDAVADDDAVAVLDDDERRADDQRVVREVQRAGRSWVRVAEARQHAVLPRHVVGARRDRAAGRPADDEAGRSEAHQVRQVRRSPGELEDLHRVVR